MSPASMPKYRPPSNSVTAPPPTPAAHAVAGMAEISNSEALLLAAWREKRYDVIVKMINLNCGIELRWHDPMFETEEEGE